MFIFKPEVALIMPEILYQFQSYNKIIEECEKTLI